MFLASHKILAVSLVVVYFTTQVVLGSSVQSNLWAERRCQVPSVLNQLPTVKTVLPNFPKCNAAKIPLLPASLRSLGDSIPFANASLLDIYDSKDTSHAPVVLIQDVHLNLEAQTNIASVIQALINQKQIQAVGIEGAFSVYDFARFRSGGDRQKIQETAKDLLAKSQIAAPSYVGLTSPSAPPSFIGVDNMEHYEANIQAYLDAQDLKEKAIQELRSQKQNLIEAKKKYLSGDLLVVENLMEARHQDQIDFGSYVQQLAKFDLDLDFVVQQFLEAYRMESTLNFDQIDRERKTAMEKLAKTLSGKETQSLIAESLAYRLDQVGFGDYYRHLKNLCQEKGVSLKSAPAFDNYIHYVLLSDGIKADALFNAVQKMEQRITERLATTPQEIEVARTGKYLGLVDKLIQFALTSGEWEAYKKIVLGRSNVDRRNLLPFERFYCEADVRSQKIAENFLKAVSGTAVLVVGGFHSNAIKDLLKKQKISYVVASPKITKVASVSGSSYLSVFSREKTPLENLFTGHKLFINPASVAEVGATRSMAVNQRSRFLNIERLTRMAIATEKRFYVARDFIAQPNNSAAAAVLLSSCFALFFDFSGSGWFPIAIFAINALYISYAAFAYGVAHSPPATSDNTPSPFFSAFVKLHWPAHSNVSIHYSNDGEPEQAWPDSEENNQYLLKHGLAARSKNLLFNLSRLVFIPITASHARYRLAGANPFLLYLLRPVFFIHGLIVLFLNIPILPFLLYVNYSLHGKSKSRKLSAIKAAFVWMLKGPPRQFRAIASILHPVFYRLDDAEVASIIPYLESGFSSKSSIVVSEMSEIISHLGKSLYPFTTVSFLDNAYSALTILPSSEQGRIGWMLLDIAAKHTNIDLARKSMGLWIKARLSGKPAYEGKDLYQMGNNFAVALNSNPNMIDQDFVAQLEKVVQESYGKPKAFALKILFIVAANQGVDPKLCLEAQNCLATEFLRNPENLLVIDDSNFFFAKKRLSPQLRGAMVRLLMTAPPAEKRVAAKFLMNMVLRSKLKPNPTVDRAIIHALYRRDAVTRKAVATTICSMADINVPMEQNVLETIADGMQRGLLDDPAMMDRWIYYLNQTGANRFITQEMMTTASLYVYSIKETGAYHDDVAKLFAPFIKDSPESQIEFFVQTFNPALQPFLPWLTKNWRYFSHYLSLRLQTELLINNNTVIAGFLMSETNELLIQEKAATLRSIFQTECEPAVIRYIIDRFNQVKRDNELSFLRQLNNALYANDSQIGRWVKDWQIFLEEYVPRFGYLANEDLLDVFRSLHQGLSLNHPNLASYNLPALGITHTGNEGIEELFIVMKKVTASIFDHKTINKSLLENPLVATYVGKVTGFNTVEWGHGSKHGIKIKDFVDDHQQNHRRTKTERSLRRVIRRFLVNMIGRITLSREERETFERYQKLIAETIMLRNQTSGDGSFDEAIVSRIIASLRKENELPKISDGTRSDPKKLERAIANLAREATLLQDIITHLEKESAIEAIHILIARAGWIIDKNKDLQNIAIMALLNQGLILNPRTEENLQSIVTSTPSSQSISKLIEFKTAVIGKPQGTEAGSGQEHVLSRWSKKESLKALEVFNVGVLQEALMVVKRTEESVSIKAFFDRGILGAMAGDIGNACYTELRHIMNYPRMVGSILFTEGEGLEEHFIGSMLILESTIRGEKVWLLRGINPTDDFLARYSAQDFIKGAIEYATALAKGHSVHKIVVTEAQGALSNRAQIESAIKKFIIEEDQLDSLETFNNYTIRKVGIVASLNVKFNPFKIADWLQIFKATREKKEMEKGVQLLADILGAISENRIADALVQMQGLVKLNVGHPGGDGVDTPQFILSWDKWARDPQFRQMLQAKLGNRFKGISSDNQDLLALALHNLGGPESNNLRAYIMKGQENAAVVMAGIMLGGLGKPTRLFVEKEQEGYYEAIAKSLNKIGGKVEVVSYSNPSEIGLDVKSTFNPERLNRKYLPELKTGDDLKNVLFILSSGIKPERQWTYVFMLNQIISRTLRENLEHINKVVQIIRKQA